MSSLYEIDEQILQCIDAETGEIIDEERLNELQIERETKLENVALWIKNLKADAASYKAEKEAFAEREKTAKEKAERLSAWLEKALDGQKMTTVRVAVTFRNSESVEIPDASIVPKKWCRKEIKYTPDKVAIKAAIKAGLKVKGCSISENRNINIK